MPMTYIAELIRSDLEQVKNLMMQRLDARAAILSAAGWRALDGAEACRAALVLLAAHLGEFALEQTIHAAAAAEFIDAAHQMHGRLVSDGERRLGAVGHALAWKGNAHLMVGDYLFAMAASEMALAPDPRIIAYYSGCVMAFCESELSPVLTLAPVDEALDQYLYVAHGRTGALFEAACKAGVVCGKGSDEVIAAAGRFGDLLGIAAHILADVAVFNDTNGGASRLQRGSITLPMIYAADAVPGGGIADVLGQTAPSIAQIGELRTAVRQSGVLSLAHSEAVRYRNLALRELHGLPASAGRDALEQFAVGLVPGWEAA